MVVVILVMMMMMMMLMINVDCVDGESIVIDETAGDDYEDDGCGAPPPLSFSLSLSLSPSPLSVLLLSSFQMTPRYRPRGGTHNT